MPLVGMLGGCLGLTTPDLQEPYEGQLDEQAHENVVLNQVRCEIHKGVQDAIDGLSDSGPGRGYGAEWLRDWVAKVNIKMTVDEKAAANPGLTFNVPYRNAIDAFPRGGNVTTAQSFSLGLGAQGSADATRTETIGVTYVLRDLLRDRLANPCDHRGSVLVESDLKIGEFILNKASLARIPGNVQPDKLRKPFDVLNYEASFVVSYGGSLTPTWKFARVAANQGATLLGASRSRTHDVTVTLGPVERDKSGVVRPTSTVDENHFASLIGQAVARSIESQR